MQSHSTYKIALVGTHGTGKSALAANIVGQLKSRGVESVALQEMATRAYRFGLPINEKTTIAAQSWILHQQLAEELLFAHINGSGKNHRVVVCDRGPDNYCYLEHNVGVNHEALSLVLNHMKQFPYARIYLLPVIDATPDPNGMRGETIEFQKKMDLAVRAFLKEHDVPFTELPIPIPQDPLRKQWLKIIVNNTLKDLQEAEHKLM